ncbi:Phospholipase A and acyltransferase 2 [Bulinus truncatus]|nr:Phospholipase A and acyltransferase 2 [Bulinus truncatus]
MVVCLACLYQLYSDSIFENYENDQAKQIDEYNGKVFKDLKFGSKVQFPRKRSFSLSNKDFNLFSHFAIYIGDSKVIHLDKVPEISFFQKISALVYSNGYKVQIISIESVAEGKPYYINNDLDEICGPFQNDKIVSRANERVEITMYALFWYNCEHFVNICRYNLWISEQLIPAKFLLRRHHATTTSPQSVGSKSHTFTLSIAETFISWGEHESLT